MRGIGLVITTAFAYLKKQPAAVTMPSTMSAACADDDCNCTHSTKHRHGKGAPSKAPITTTGKEILFVDDASELSKIVDDTTQLVIWRQSTSGPTPSYLDALSNESISPEHLPSFAGLVPARPGIVAEILKPHLYLPYDIRSRPNVLNEVEADELAARIDTLVQHFADVSLQSGYMDDNEDEFKYVHVKLEVMTTDGCKFWHQDHVPFRLVSTLRGPCTEFVLPKYSRIALERREGDCEHALSMKLNDVSIFKGRGGTDSDSLYDQPGIVHRSPRLDEGKESRLLLVIDIPSSFHFN